MLFALLLALCRGRSKWLFASESLPLPLLLVVLSHSATSWALANLAVVG